MLDMWRSALNLLNRGRDSGSLPPPFGGDSGSPVSPSPLPGVDKVVDPARDFNVAEDFYLSDCKNPHMMENAMSRPPGEVMSTTAVKPMKHAPAPQKEVKVFFRPHFGIKAHGCGLSVDVSARQEKDKDGDKPKRG